MATELISPKSPKPASRKRTLPLKSLRQPRGTAKGTAKGTLQSVPDGVPASVPKSAADRAPTCVVGRLLDDETTNAACVSLGQDPVFQAGLMRAFALAEALHAQQRNCSEIAPTTAAQKRQSRKK